MGEPSSPEPERLPGGRRGLRRAASTVGGCLGCLVLPVLVLIAAAGALGIFLSDPTFWIAVAALLVAVSAYKASTRGR